MWNAPTEQELIEAVPRFYETENISLADKMIHMHFFIGSCDWYLAEYNPENGLCFGYTILNGDTEMAEWGYFSLDELKEIKVKNAFEVDRDMHWKVRKASEIENIKTY